MNHKRKVYEGGRVKKGVHGMGPRDLGPRPISGPVPSGLRPKSTTPVDLIIPRCERMVLEVS